MGMQRTTAEREAAGRVHGRSPAPGAQEAANRSGHVAAVASPEAAGHCLAAAGTAGRGAGPALAAHVQRLQRTHGNRAVQRYLQASRAGAATAPAGMGDAAAATPVVAQRGRQPAGTAPRGPVAVQRLIYKDEKERGEQNAYADIAKVPWYQGKQAEEKVLILRAAKIGSLHLTTAEVDGALKDRKAFENMLAHYEIMSGHVDLVEHASVPLEERVLTPEEFTNLPARGSINPNRLRTAQGGIELQFREKSKGKVEDLAARLAEDPEFGRKNKIPAVAIGVFNGRVWSFDTRRVVAHQKARAKNQNVLIEYEKISPKDLEARVSSIYTPRPGMGLVTAVRFEGRSSGSEPWINPAYEKQLPEVSGHWDRSNYDFPEQFGAPPGGQFDLSGRQNGELFRRRLRLIRVSGDNDCLFHAVNIGTGWHLDVKTFRDRIATWVEDHLAMLVAQGRVATAHVAQVLRDIRQVGSYFNEGGFLAYEVMGVYLEERGYSLSVIQQNGQVQQVANNANLRPVYLLPTSNPPHSHFHVALPKAGRGW